MAHWLQSILIVVAFLLGGLAGYTLAGASDKKLHSRARSCGEVAIVAPSAAQRSWSSRSLVTTTIG